MDLVKSKKFQAAVIAVLLMIASEFGLDLDPEALLAIASPLLLYILGQSVADVGKEKAKVENGTRKKNVPLNQSVSDRKKVI